MPHPHGRERLSPDDLARELAGKLASSRPKTARFSLRNSVLVGRLISGLVVLAMGVAILGAVLIGVDWWADRSSSPEVLATAEITEAVASSPTGLDTSGAGDTQGLLAAQAALIVAPSSVFPQLPPPTAPVPGTARAPSATAPQVPSSTPATPPTLATTTTVSSTTLPSTTSTTTPVTSSTGPGPTTTQPSTTSTDPPGTATIAPTTTTLPETTTTCGGNNGGGNGSGPCGP